MRALRRLVLGETRTLPVAVALAVLAAGVLRLLSDDAPWWRDAGGAILAAFVLVALAVSVRSSSR